MREYSKVKLVVHDNAIFITDIKDGDCIAIHPEAWEHIKYNIDQQITDGYLDYEDEDYER